MPSAINFTEVRVFQQQQQATDSGFEVSYTWSERITRSNHMYLVHGWKQANVVVHSGKYVEFPIVSRPLEIDSQNVLRETNSYTSANCYLHGFFEH